MLTALSQMSPISAASSFADADLLSLGDVNGDGVFNNADVQSLLDMLKTAGSSLTAVPEPATFVLMVLALPGVTLAAVRRRGSKLACCLEWCERAPCNCNRVGSSTHAVVRHSKNRRLLS